MNPTELKKTLSEGRPVFGFMLYATDGIRWGRILTGLPIDYIVIDAEHGSRDRQEMAALSLMCKSAGLTAIVRVAAPDPVLVAMALDAGCDGVLVPYCETPEDVRECAWKVRLHPLKGRAFKDAMERDLFPSEKARSYIEARHKNNLFIMGVESIAAVEKIDTLLECAPMDGVFVGPNDLTTSLGIPDEVEHPDYLAVLRTIVEKSEARNLPVMIHHQNLDASMRSLEVGSRFVLHGSDATFMRQAVTRDFNALREAASNKWQLLENTDHAKDDMEAI